MERLDDFQEIWLADFEFRQPDGETPTPHCLVAREFRTGQLIRLAGEELASLPAPPFKIGSDALFVAYYASAELGCFQSLGWRSPANVLDLFVEFRVRTNGLALPAGNGLIGALTSFGLDAIAATEKDEMRELAIRGGPFTSAEMQALLDYCQSDVDALARLLPAMADGIDLSRALLRGRYMRAVASMERVGIPIDTRRLTLLRENWDEIRAGLIAAVDPDYQVYDGLAFRTERFEAYLAREGIPWVRLPTGRVELSDDAFRQAVRAYSRLAPLRELRHTLGQMRRIELPVGADGRNRCLLSPFRSKTGRNQPSNSKFAFGPSAWLRSLIQPAEGRSIAYIDYGQQEFAIAAALSGDEAMMRAYTSGDPYLAFAIQAGAAPADATKATHKPIREQFKLCALGVQYGMGPESLAVQLGQPAAYARELLEKHRQTYPTYWRWSRSAVDTALTLGRLWTVFGWQVRVGDRDTDRSLANWPMQANGAEMLRIACCLLTEAGIEVCAPIHDAVLIEAAIDEIDVVVERARSLMADASRIVLDGFGVRTDATIVRYPERYIDERGVSMWETVMGLLPGRSMA